MDIPVIMVVWDKLHNLPAILQLASYIIFIYFLGVLLSRIGSFLKEISMKWNLFGMKKTSVDYETFVKSEMDDDKLPILNRQANLYRNLAGMFLTLTLLYLVDGGFSNISTKAGLAVLLLIFMLIFLLSWKKQNGYIRRRADNT